MHLRRTVLTVLAALAIARPAAAVQERPRPIQDNSFLVEEAYNQERRVVQHISVFQRGDAGAFEYAFTQEWPMMGQRHQLSYTLLVQRAGAQSATGLSDIALNYRYQLVGNGEQAVAVAPRASLVLLTGSAGQELDAGHWGVQANLPVSWQLSQGLVTHWNAGLTAIPHAHDPRATVTGVNLGLGTIWLATPAVNLMLETAWTREEVVSGPGTTEMEEELVVSPGARVAINRGNLQIVPGIAVPIGVGPSRGTTSLIFYLSLEHPYSAR